MKIKRTTHTDTSFRKLVQDLDRFLAKIDGDEHAFYHQYNGIDQLKHCLVLELNYEAVACGALYALDEQTVEIKRMYVKPEYRNKGFGSRLLICLESWAKEIQYAKCVLETGRRQPDAVALYEKNAYSIIENYGPYKGVDNSICFLKTL